MKVVNQNPNDIPWHFHTQARLLVAQARQQEPRVAELDMAYALIAFLLEARSGQQPVPQKDVARKIKIPTSPF